MAGRMGAVAAPTDRTWAAPGGGTVRVFLKLIFVTAIALESLTADPLMQFGTYMHRGIGTWLGAPIFLSPFEIVLMLGVVVALASGVPEGARRTRVLMWPMRPKG